MEKPRSTKPSTDDVKSAKSTDWRQSFNAGLARVINRERRSYQQLAEKVAAAERLALSTRSDIVQTKSPAMVDIGVQSDHAVDLLARTECRRPMIEETVVRPEKVDKSTTTDDDWLPASSSDDVMTDTAGDVEHLMLEDAVKDTASSQLHYKYTEKKEEQEEEEHKIVVTGRSVSSRTGQKFHVVSRAISDDEAKRDMTSPAKQRSEKFADELLLPTPWAARASLTQLNLARLQRHRAVFARSDEHMVIMEVEPSDEQSKHEPVTKTDIADQALGDRVATEDLLKDKVGLDLTHLDFVKFTDGKVCFDDVNVL